MFSVICMIHNTILYLYVNILRRKKLKQYYYVNNVLIIHYLRHA